MIATLRRIGAHPLLEQHVSRGLRARLVTPSWRFAVRDLRGRGTYRYSVRRTGAQVVLEHGTPDIPTLDQAFYQDVYEPAPQALARLQALGRPIRALDLGANIGLWSVWLAGRLPVERIVAVEPEPRNVARLRENVAGLPVEVVAAAATTADGTLRFGGGDTTTGHILEGTDAGIAVEARDVYGLLDGIDLLKIDIEGAEWPITADPRFRELDVPVVVLEHHPHDAPAEGPGPAAERVLREAGYSVERTLEEPDGTGMVWGVKARR